MLDLITPSIFASSTSFSASSLIRHIQRRALRMSPHSLGSDGRVCGPYWDEYEAQERNDKSQLRRHPALNFAAHHFVAQAGYDVWKQAHVAVKEICSSRRW